MDSNTTTILVAGIGGLLAAVGSLFGVLHLHAKSKCCGRRVEIDIDAATPPTTSTATTALVNEADKKNESEKQ